MDKAVFWVTLLGGVFILGMEVGEDNAATHLANTCTKQPGETLVSTFQTKQGVICQYANAPRKATWTRRDAT